MRSWKAYLLASAALACWGIAEPANAQLVYGGGATFPAPVYRMLFDCHNQPVDGNPAGPTWPNGQFLPGYPISPYCASPTGISSGQFYFQMLYAPVGSGAGKRAMYNHDGSTNTTTGLGTPAAANPVPFVSTWQPTYGYPNLQFAGSDDPWNSSDAAAYAATGNATSYGQIVQMPSLGGAVVIAFNANDGNGNPLNINNAVPAGASADAATYSYPGSYSGLNLSRQAVCGIFTGHITKWDNSILTALNGGVPLGHGQIKVVHRTDGSGTNFIFTNGLYQQCANEWGPNTETDSTTASYEFRFSERGVSGTCPAVLYESGNSTNWPDFGTDSCGNAIPDPNPGVDAFLGENGNGTVAATIQSTNGAIGYTTTDYTQPAKAAPAPQVANVQSEYDLDNNTGAFEWPSPVTIANAINPYTPNFPSQAALANPLNWTQQGKFPNPDAPNAYPLVGFTWLEFYQCYAPARSGGGTLANLFNYLNFHYYDSHANAILNSQGFISIPHPWRDPIIPMIASGPALMGSGGDPSNPACAAGPGA